MIVPVVTIFLYFVYFNVIVILNKNAAYLLTYLLTYLLSCCDCRTVTLLFVQFPCSIFVIVSL